MIPRSLTPVICSDLFAGKVIMLIGARQVGKSTLFRHIDVSQHLNALILNCDEPDVREMLRNPMMPELKILIGEYKVVIIDEAQRVDGIGLTLKRIYENFPQIQLLVTGSSSLALRDRLNEPLTGRKFEYNLYPISTNEILRGDGGLLEVKRLLEPRMIYGSYPEVITNLPKAQKILLELTDSYLYRDMLTLDYIKRPDLISKILTALALQVSSEVSYNEIAKTVGSDSKTVEKYINLLEQCYVIFRLGAFSRNLRNELKKSKKIYFYDNGIRNAIISNFAPLRLRSDCGALWENFFISERVKYNHYKGRAVNTYFWRTNLQQEIDYVEEMNGEFYLFELKWNPSIKASFPKSFLKTYPVKEVVKVTPENYLDYLTDQ